MPGRYRRFAAPVRHNKEIIDGVFIAVAGGTTTTVTVATAVNDYVGASATCPISAKIKAVWIQLSYQNESVSQARLDWLLMKVPANVAAAALVPGATGTSVLRKYILKESKGLNPKVAGSFVATGVGWIMIPKRFQNMAEGDVWQIKVNASDLYSFCVKIIYKWLA